MAERVEYEFRVSYEENGEQRLRTFVCAAPCAVFTLGLREQKQAYTVMARPLGWCVGPDGFAPSEWIVVKSEVGEIK